MGDLERRTAVAARDCEANLASEYDRIHVEDIAGHEVLDQVIRLQISKLFEKRPDVFRVIQLAYSDSPCHRSRFDEPRCRHAVKESSEIAVMEDRRELRHGN